ncbi:hypothetical protein PAXRUDRAFT_821981 [Paxillus rubicundulus Ve08.2h10]|uniref:Uncharacterized protein n=1 Tax=Paxillus rubicundulus Ve08.2h10 TaxID=930991 RepID=A0A0D0ECY5_9AGAM|nr:hypothetical protein PAXRUDRAFT_821981 [Paxillus rubicundulus Ve08.2h10]
MIPRCHASIISAPPSEQFHLETSSRDNGRRFGWEDKVVLFRHSTSIHRDELFRAVKATGWQASPKTHNQFGIAFGIIQGNSGTKPIEAEGRTLEG